MATIISRLLSDMPTTEMYIEYIDNDSISDYAMGHIQRLSNAKIFSGSNGMFNPLDYATRAQCAKILTLASEVTSPQ